MKNRSENLQWYSVPSVPLEPTNPSTVLTHTSVLAKPSRRPRADQPRARREPRGDALVLRQRDHRRRRRRERQRQEPFQRAVEPHVERDGVRVLGEEFVPADWAVSQLD